jgi:mutator protein MutT
MKIVKRYVGVLVKVGEEVLLCKRNSKGSLPGEWSIPAGSIEEGESPEQAALREVQEETGIESVIEKSLGVIDFWFMAGGKRIHKTVHHYLFRESGGLLAPQETEVDEVAWFPLAEIVERLAYPDEKKLIARTDATAEVGAK